MPTHAQRLIYAVRTRNYDRLCELIREHRDVSARSTAGRTALHAAAEEGDIEAARILFDAGADANVRMSTGETPLHLAAAYGGGGLCDFMESDLDRRDPCSRNRHKPIKPETAMIMTAILKEKVPELPPDLGPMDDFPEENRGDIFFAAFESFADPAQLLEEFTKRGVDLDRVDPDFAESLRGKPRFLRVVELLLDRGADIHALSDSGASILEGAVEQGKPAMVELLLKRGADPNRPSDSLIGKALDRSCIEVAEVLLNHGTIFDPDASFALHSAASNGRLEIVRWLLERGADIDKCDDRGNTPLLDAAGHADVMAFLLARGANIYACNHEGNGVLHAAAAWHSCLAHLLQLGLPINKPNEEGRTALHLAATGDPAAIQALLRAGAAVNAQDHAGNTPLHAIFFSDEFRPDVEFPAFHAMVSGGADRSIRNGEGKTAFDLGTQWHYPEEYLKLLDPKTNVDADSFLWLGNEPYAQFLPKAKVSFELDGVVWPSSEHYFHAQKTKDPEIRELIRQAKDGNAAVCRLRELKVERSLAWEGRCDDVMRSALLAKVRQNESVRRLLLATGNAILISDSNCDWYWVERKDVDFNTIGKMLMDIRGQLLGEAKESKQ